MASPSRQSLCRASIFRCFNRHVQCLNASRLKRAPQPANKVLQTRALKYCDIYVKKTTHMSHLAQMPNDADPDTPVFLSYADDPQLTRV